MDLKELRDFIRASMNSTYAAGSEAKPVKEKDSSTSFNYSDGDYKYHDNFFGGEPYGGREVV